MEFCSTFTGSQAPAWELQSEAGASRIRYEAEAS